MIGSMNQSYLLALEEDTYCNASLLVTSFDSSDYSYTVTNSEDLTLSLVNGDFLASL